jgi:hypothetical protein
VNSYSVQLTMLLNEPINDELEAHLDGVAEAFTDIPDVDGDVGMNVAKGQVDLCMTLAADSPADAIAKAIVSARHAIHAAGGNTPGWDGMIPKLLETEEFQSTVMPSAWRQVHVV